MLLLLLPLISATKTEKSLAIIDTTLYQQYTAIVNISEKQDTLEEQVEILKGEINLLEMDNLRQDVEFKKGQSGWSFLTDREEECCIVLLGVTVFSVLLLFIN
jgi:hypothetical protein